MRALSAEIGLVSSKQCLIIANEATLKGGAISEMGMHRSTPGSPTSGSPTGYPRFELVESAGAWTCGAEPHLRARRARIPRDPRARVSRERIPSVSVVFGNCTAGGAYHPGMTDYVIMVRNQAKVFLAGPPLVKMATGEVVDEETLGGAEMHSSISGLSDYLAESELDGIRTAREIVANLNREPVARSARVRPNRPLLSMTCSISSPPTCAFPSMSAR